MPDILNGVAIRENSSYCIPYQATVVTNKHVWQWLAKELSVILIDINFV